MKKIRSTIIFSFSVGLFNFALLTEESLAFDPGAQVLIREGRSGGDWTPGVYVGPRSDCLILERLRPYPGKMPFLLIPTSIKQENFKVGDEVEERPSHDPLPNSKFPSLVDRVVALKQYCHEVSFNGGPFKQYVLPGNIYESGEFKKLRGSKLEFSEGDEVYAMEYQVWPERWSPRKIVSKRSDCYETDSEKIVAGFYGEEKFSQNIAGQFFSTPLKITKDIKRGDNLGEFYLKVEKSEEGVSYSSLEGVVKSRTKDTLTLESSNEDCSYDPVSIANIRQAPSPLSKKDLAQLKPGDIVFEMIFPACCCCSQYLARYKIKSQKRSCYLLRKGEAGDEMDARIPTQLIPAEVFKR